LDISVPQCDNLLVQHRDTPRELTRTGPEPHDVAQAGRGSPTGRFKAAIFDLDNCLSAADEVGEELFEPAFMAIRKANDGRLDEEVLAAAFSDCWVHALDFVARKHGFSDSMLAAGWKALCKVEVTAPMRGYGDLQVLKELNLMRFLVTSGFRRLQESKIRALGIGGWFQGVYIDAIDEPDRKGKQRIFAEILAQNGLQPEYVLVVGDNADSEIEAGRSLGIDTVQMLRRGVSRAGNATWHVKDLEGVRKLTCASAGSSVSGVSGNRGR
jgi:putative hydrolase of the HAD superfamily